jgi:hypothetical protein
MKKKQININEKINLKYTFKYNYFLLYVKININKLKKKKCYYNTYLCSIMLNDKVFIFKQKRKYHEKNLKKYI